MAIGDVAPVSPCPGIHYADTGMYDTPKYGAVYIIDGERPALVESGIGTDYELILDAMDAVGIVPADLAVIALTHVHLDHAGGAGFLARDCPNAEVYAHHVGAPHLADPTRLVEGTKAAVGDQWGFYTDPLPVPEERIVALDDGDTIDLGDRTLVVHYVPGHASHQVVFHSPTDDAVFTADAAGMWVPQRESVFQISPPPEFDLDQCLDDVETIRDLDPETLLYTHFGPGPDGVDGALDDYRRVLREWVAAVESALAELDDEEAVVEHFAASTEMTELWGETKARETARLDTRGVLTSLRRLEASAE